MGAVIPPFVFEANQGHENISSGLRIMQISYSAVAGAAFILVTVCKYLFNYFLLFFYS